MKGATALAVWVALTFAMAGAARSSQTGGLASPLRPGGFALSATLGYAERDVRDGPEDEVSAHKVLFRAALGVLDAVDVYATAGFADAELDRGDFQGRLGETLGVGAHCGLLDFPDSSLRLVLDVQGEYARSVDGHLRLRSQAYHAALYLVKETGAAGQIGYFYPYGGVRLSYARYDGSGGLEDTRADDVAGIFAGADYFVNPEVFFTGELHLFDETSVYLGVGYRL